MNTFEVLCGLSAQTQFEVGEEKDRPTLLQRTRPVDELQISHAMLPNGKQIRLLKTLLSSACERDCYYCPFRAGRDFRRESLKPDEMARIFMSIYYSSENHAGGRI